MKQTRGAIYRLFFQLCFFTSYKESYVLWPEISLESQAFQECFSCFQGVENCKNFLSCPEYRHSLRSMLLLAVLETLPAVLQPSQHYYKWKDSAHSLGPRLPPENGGWIIQARELQLSKGVDTPKWLENVKNA